jgi:hypothetical protein
MASAGRLAGPAAIPNTITTVFTATGPTVLKSFDGCNTVQAAVGLFIHLVPSGGSATPANALRYGTRIAPATDPAGGFWWEGEIVLAAGDTIQVRGSVVGLTLTHLSGVTL